LAVGTSHHSTAALNNRGNEETVFANQTTHWSLAYLHRVPPVKGSNLRRKRSVGVEGISLFLNSDRNWSVIIGGK
jgi:hypothetical protein